jgi:hypothetical protein
VKRQAKIIPFVSLLILSWVIHLMLKFWGFERSRQHRFYVSFPLNEALKAYRALDRRRWIPSSCLTQALTLWLTSDEHQLKLHFGVRKEDLDVKAHAWLSIDDDICWGAREEDYQELRILSQR